MNKRPSGKTYWRHISTLAAILLCLFFWGLSGQSELNKLDQSFWSFSSGTPIYIILIAVILFLNTFAKLIPTQANNFITRLSEGNLFFFKTPVMIVFFSLLFLAFFDRSESGDYYRIIGDVEHNVLLLKAEPFTPLIFKIVDLFSFVLFSAWSKWGSHTSTLTFETVLGLRVGTAIISSFGVVGLWKIAQHLSDSNSNLKTATFCLLLSSGSSALFFCHIEAYTIPTVLMIWFIYFALRALQDNSLYPRSCLFLTLAAAVHMQMLCLVPTTLLLGYYTVGIKKTALIGLKRIVLPLLIIQMACLVLPPPYDQYFGGGDGKMFVTLSHFFSSAHWLTFSNLILLFTPGFLVFALALPGTNWKVLSSFDSPVIEELSLVIILAVSWLLFALFWNPDLGPWKDWDLFAAMGFPLLLVPAAIIARTDLVSSKLNIIVLIILVNLSRTVPFVLDNHLNAYLSQAG